MQYHRLTQREKQYKMAVAATIDRVKIVGTVVGISTLALANNSLMKECSKFPASAILKPRKVCMIVVNTHTHTVPFSPWYHDSSPYELVQDDREAKKEMKRDSTRPPIKGHQE